MSRHLDNSWGLKAGRKKPPIKSSLAGAHIHYCTRHLWGPSSHLFTYTKSHSNQIHEGNLSSGFSMEPAVGSNTTAPWSFTQQLHGLWSNITRYPTTNWAFRVVEPKSNYQPDRRRDYGSKRQKDNMPE